MKTLHVGCGPIHIDGYVNIDINPKHRPDICADVSELPYEKLSIDAIFGCHFFEHLQYPEKAVTVLGKFYDWLKHGGILRLVVPDLEIAAHAYVTTGDLRFLYAEDFKAYYYKNCKAERLNFFVKAWEHQMCYDYDLMSKLLRDAGFENIEKKKPNESKIPGFCHDRFIGESLFVEAIK